MEYKKGETLFLLGRHPVRVEVNDSRSVVIHVSMSAPYFKRHLDHMTSIYMRVSGEENRRVFLHVKGEDLARPVTNNRSMKHVLQKSYLK